MTLFSSYGLQKSFNDRLLFKDISFGMEKGERIGLIGRNGAGKTTLLEIINGTTEPDEGEIIFNKWVTHEYLPQLPDLNGTDPIIDSVMKAAGDVYNMLEEHTMLCGLPPTEERAEKLQKLNQKIEHAGGWHLENESLKILGQLGISDYRKHINELSGGMRKRVALARALLSKPDLLILDEPTNHLDADSVQWLQDRLMNSSQSLLFVTHDRYFLDALTTGIIEIDQSRLFSYPGNYEKYLEQKENFLRAQEATVEHNIMRLRTELAWLQKGAKARRTKQKSRIDWIDELKKKTFRPEDKNIEIELGKTFTGKRIIEAHYISKSIDGKLLFSDFSYMAKPMDRIGIIGPNGSGKTTLLKVLSGEVKPDDGTIQIGATVNIGFFRQEITDLDDDMTVIDAVREIADRIDVGFGRDRYLSAKDLLNKFLFHPRQHTARIKTLSGGEKRRLALIRVLMKNPNILLLDEPTNDFDIQTLNALESYLDDFYGTLLIVSHDRAFLDRTVEFIYAFDGKGNIKEYPGNYSNYLEKKEQQERGNAEQKSREKRTSKKNSKPRSGTSGKLSYKDKLEYERLEKEIPELERKKKELEAIMNDPGMSDYKELEEIGKEIVRLEKDIDESTMRWLELSESVK